MRKIFTIGFTKKTAKKFFEILKSNEVDIIIDIRLKNTSQLAAFAKLPDIEYFLKEICDIYYIHDKLLAPSKETLARFKNNIIDWDTYIKEFKNTMKKRKIKNHIISNYRTDKNICLLCSEYKHENCHRSLVAKQFKEIFQDVEIFHL